VRAENWLVYGIYIKAPVIPSGFYMTIPPMFRQAAARRLRAASYLLGGATMDPFMDTLVVTLGIALFAISIAYVTVCERL
jgi:hypothetical protein